MMRTIPLLLLPILLVPSVRADDAKAARNVRQVIAHRGSMIDRPENTLSALRLAIVVKANITEVDVRTTSDGVLICMHDAELSRTTDGKGKVSGSTLAELKKLDAGAWFDRKYKGERVPTLREALAAAKNKIDLMIDLKEDGDEYVRKIADEVKSHGEPKRTVLGVRSVEQAKLFKKLLPQARQIGLVPTVESIESFAEAGVSTIRLWPKWLSDEKLVPRVRKLKLGLLLGAGKGTKDEVVPLLKYAPEILSADDPSRLLRTLAEIGKKE
jgi:glycerophosphoryl diester phosphodiesterase